MGTFFLSIDVIADAFHEIFFERTCADLNIPSVDKTPEEYNIWLSDGMINLFRGIWVTVNAKTLQLQNIIGELKINIKATTQNVAKKNTNKKGVSSAKSSRSVQGLGKGVSGKPYPRLCNARRPQLEPGTFQSQAVRLYRLHQARPSQLRESETKYSKKHTSASRDVLESPFTEHNCEKSDAHLTAFLNRPNM